MEPPDDTNSPALLIERLRALSRAAHVPNDLYQRWLAFYITNVVALREERAYPLAQGKKRISLCALVYRQLLRAFARLLAVRPPISLESLAARHPTWVHALSTYSNLKEEDDEDVARERTVLLGAWPKSPEHYDTAETRAVAMLLTQMCAELSQEAADDASALFDALRVRAARGDLDSFFCMCYLGELHRRFYYHDALQRRTLPLPLEADALTRSVRAWVEHTVLPMFPSEALGDLYAQVCEEAYRLPGDRVWFTHSYPNAVYSTGAALAKLRPHLHPRFFSEQDACEPHLLLEHAERGTHHPARMLVIRLVTQYLQMRGAPFRWDDAVVLQSADLDSDSRKLLLRDQAPLLVQVLANFWTYDNGRVYITDNVFASVAIWFHVLRQPQRYGGAIYGQYSELLSAVAAEALGMK
jgi:hypothetical protein